MPVLLVGFPAAFSVFRADRRLLVVAASLLSLATFGDLWDLVSDIVVGGSRSEEDIVGLAGVMGAGGGVGAGGGAGAGGGVGAGTVAGSLNAREKSSSSSLASWPPVDGGLCAQSGVMDGKRSSSSRAISFFIGGVSRCLTMNFL